MSERSKVSDEVGPITINFDVSGALQRAKLAIMCGMDQEGYKNREPYRCIERHTYDAAFTALREASDAIAILKELGVIKEAERERAFDPPTCP